MRRSAAGFYGELHYRLRTEASTPLRRSAAVGLGTFVGCLPLWGAHFLLCVGLARLFGVSRITTYLAAHINNPITAPFLVYVELWVGHLLLTGNPPRLDLLQLRSGTLLQASSDLVVGSLAVAIVLALVLAAVTWTIASGWRDPPPVSWLREETARPFLACGVRHWEFVRGKLRYDPLYFGLLRAGILPERGLLLDLGCGRGILEALLLAAASAWRTEHWDAGWPRPPLALRLEGVEVREAHARVARQALGDRATIRNLDLRAFDPEPADVIVLTDVLHYLTPPEQETLIRRAARATKPGGLLLLREANATGGVRFFMTRVQERLCAIGRGHPGQRFHYRSAGEWCRLVAAEGLEVALRPLDDRTPFANVLVEARRPPLQPPAPRA